YGCLAIRLLDVDEEPLLDCRPRAPSGPCMAAIGGGAHPLPPSVAASSAPPIPTTAVRRQHQQPHSRCPRPGLRLLRPHAGAVDGGGEWPPRTPSGAPT